MTDLWRLGALALNVLDFETPGLLGRSVADVQAFVQAMAASQHMHVAQPKRALRILHAARACPRRLCSMHSPPCMPTGFQLVANRGGDAALLALALDWEQAFARAPTWPQEAAATMAAP